MSKELTTNVAEAEAAAQLKQAAEEIAHQRFDAVRSGILAAGNKAEPTDTKEFHEWMQARHASDEAWGRWAMAMDAQAAG